MKYQTRTIAAFPNRTGYLVGSIEGRVAVHHVEDPSDPKANFTFKCHRGDGNHIYSVNDIAFHPQVRKRKRETERERKERRELLQSTCLLTFPF